ncbi:MAG TPA: hypothetical protein ENN69_02900 [Spirochaetia bacterium]|nr:hypothetical protein [Spirochaetia bacterium]
MSVPLFSGSVPLTRLAHAPSGYLDCVLGAPDVAGTARPGQFVMVGLPGRTDPLLARPFDIVEVFPETGEFRLIIKVVGKATRLLKELGPGDRLTVTGPLGKPITDYSFSSLALLVRGCGAAAVLFFLQEARRNNIRVHTVLSAATEEKLICRSEIAALSDSIHFATDDGSLGEKLLGTEVLRRVLSEHHVERVYSCGGGPFYQPYLEEIEKSGALPVYLFLESYMACGFGACHGCAVKKREGGYALVCQDGPLFRLRDIADPCLIYQ